MLNYIFNDLCVSGFVLKRIGKLKWKIVVFLFLFLMEREFFILSLFLNCPHPGCLRFSSSIEYTSPSLALVNLTGRVAGGKM